MATVATTADACGYLPRRAAPVRRRTRPPRGGGAPSDRSRLQFVAHRGANLQRTCQPFEVWPCPGRLFKLVERCADGWRNGGIQLERQLTQQTGGRVAPPREPLEHGVHEFRAE